MEQAATSRKGKKIEIDRDIFERACAHFSNRNEICYLFNCSFTTLRRWVRETYGTSFEDTANRLQSKGKLELRDCGFQMAKKNPRAHIFYAKNYLGMTDAPQPIDTGEKITELASAINAAAKQIAGMDLSQMAIVPPAKELGNSCSAIDGDEEDDDDGDED